MYHFLCSSADYKYCETGSRKNPQKRCNRPRTWSQNRTEHYDAVAGIANYPVPLILIDMGTATTASVVNSKKQYVGGMILPGVGVSLDALTARASQLSGISLDAPRHVIGKNTIECMKSGVLYSNAAALDGIIDRIEEELGEKTTVVATGGLAKKIIPHCKRKIILDEELLLRGLLIIYEKNK